MSQKAITIIGGGLAGLTLGIGLRKRRVPAIVWEAGHYPRHRVCGEFISGRGQESLTRLNLLDLLVSAGAIPARTVAFLTARMAGRGLPLPQPALCLPRWQLDALLAARFREVGGELHEAERWRGNDSSEGLVFASGRQAQPVVHGWRWFGVKAHAREVATRADLEMHLLSSGYVGLCRQPGGVVNICALLRRKPGDPGDDWQAQLRGSAGSLLAERMRNATFEPGSFCAVAGINLTPQSAQAQTTCRIGDALTMIPPLTGNGMSIAFESAEAALDPLTAWSRGELAWPQARQAVARACDETFACRLAWAHWLQRMILTPWMQDFIVGFASRSSWFWQFTFARTR